MFGGPAHLNSLLHKVLELSLGPSHIGDGMALFVMIILDNNNDIALVA